MVTDTVRGAGVTATGGRKANEDALLASAPVFVVADGMGGHLAGADSSRAVVDAFHALVGAVDVTVEDVTLAVERAREGVAAVMAAHGGQSGSTLTGAVQVTVDGAPWWLVLNVGDSRVYSYRAGRLAQVTVDHSRVQEMVDAGELTPDQAERHPERNVITRAIGDGIPGQDLWLVPIARDRRMVVVSDGLTKALPHQRIEELLAPEDSPAEAARSLVETAVAAGARDNVTVVVAESGSVVTPVDASPGALRVWREPDEAPAPAFREDDEDDVTRVSARRAPLGDDDITRVSARRSREADEEEDATRVSSRRASDQDDSTRISARRAGIAEVATSPALRGTASSRRAPNAPVEPAPGSGVRPVPSPAADEARQRFAGRGGARVRTAPPRVEPSMPAPMAPVAAHEVIHPDERARRENRARLRTRVGLIGAAAGVAAATLAAAVTGVWLLVTL